MYKPHCPLVDSLTSVPGRICKSLEPIWLCFVPAEDSYFSLAITFAAAGTVRKVGEAINIFAPPPMPFTWPLTFVQTKLWGRKNLDHSSPWNIIREGNCSTVFVSYILVLVKNNSLWEEDSIPRHNTFQFQDTLSEKQNNNPPSFISSFKFHFSMLGFFYTNL